MTAHHQHRPRPQKTQEQYDDDDEARVRDLPIAALLLTTAHRISVELLEELRFEYYSVIGLLAVQHLRAAGAMAPRDLAAALGSSRPAVSQLIARLVRDELIESRPEATNRRAKVLSITPKGDDYGQWATEAGERLMRNLTDTFVEGERETLHSLLLRLERNADYHRGTRWFVTGGSRQRRNGPRFAVHVR